MSPDARFDASAGPASSPYASERRAADRDEVRAAVAGERASVEAVFLRILPRIRNLVRYLTSGDAEAEDITQEAALRVLRNLGGYREEGSFHRWVDKIVVRVTLARRRKTRAISRVTDPRELEETELTSRDPPVNEVYAARRRVVRLLDHLPSEQRDALVLHHVLEMTVPEVAEQLGAPQETIRTRLRRGKARLQELTKTETERGST